MSQNIPIFAEDRFLAISLAGLRQNAIDEPMDAADLDYRLKCEYTRQYIDERKVVLDCDGVDIDDEKLQRSRLLLTLTFPQGVTPQIMAVFGFYYMGTSAAPVGTPANEVHTLTRVGDITSGTFKLAFPDFEGRSGTTKPIVWNATIAEIEAALTRASATIGKLIKDGDVIVAGTWGAGITITYSERLANANLPLLTVDNTAMVGGTVAIAATTNGAQRVHAGTRSSSRQKVKFCMAAGDKTGAVATEMLYNCAVDSFTPTISDADDNVGLTVAIICNSTPIELDDFEVPACENPEPLEKKDCRIKIGSKWESLDLWSQTIALNDAILTGKEVYGFDGEQMETVMRSRNPSYQMPTQVLASSNDAIAATVNTKQPVETHFGQPGNRFSVLAGNALIKRQADPYPYVGELGRSAIALDITPHRDGLNVPVKIESRLDQATQFLLV